MATVYGPLVGNNALNISYAPGYTIDYPDSNAVTVLGQLYTPRVYASELDTLELASTGKIAITLNDSNVLDLLRSVAASIIEARYPGDSIVMKANDTTLTVDGGASNLTAYASNAVQLLASNDVQLVANNVVDVHGSNRVITRSSNAVDAYAQASMFFGVGDCNVYADLDGAAYGLTMYASNSVSVTSDSNVYITASNSIFLTASNDVRIQAAGGALDMTFDNGISTSTSNDYVLQATKSIVLNAAGSNVTVVLSDSNDTLALYSSNDLSLTTSNDVNVYASSNVWARAGTGVLALAAANSNVLLTLDAQDYTAALYADSNVSLSSGAGSMSLYSSNALTVSSSNSVELSATSNAGLFLFAANYSASLTAASNVYTTSDTGVWTGYGSNGASLTACNATALASATTVYAGTTASNAYLVLDAASNSATLAASNDITIAATSNLFLSGAKGQAYATFSNDSNVYLGGCNFVGMMTSNWTFNVGPSNVLVLDRDKVTINASLKINGTIDSVTQTVVDLVVEDKTIHLAYASNGVGEVNDNVVADAGLIVTGFPSGVDSNVTAVQKQYEKSLMWHYGAAGIDAMMTAPGLSNESYWEIKGGGLRLTSVRSNGTEISYGMRINQHLELEFYQRWSNATTLTYKVLHKMTRMIA